ncbi:diacylglycerol kinase [Bizionia sp. KMM 8389]
MLKKESFITNRLLSVKYAAKGAFILVTTEASIKVQFCIGIIMTIAGFYFQISTTEWLIQTLTIGLIMALEAVNTAIEEIANFVHPNYHKKIGLIKDLSAGAVFIFAITAVIIGGIIYIPKVF